MDQLVEEMRPVPQAVMVAERLAVVGRHDDDRPVADAEVVEAGKERSESRSQPRITAS